MKSGSWIVESCCEWISCAIIRDFVYMCVSVCPITIVMMNALCSLSPSTRYYSPLKVARENQEERERERESMLFAVTGVENSQSCKFLSLLQIKETPPGGGEN